MQRDKVEDHAADFGKQQQRCSWIRLRFSFPLIQETEFILNGIATLT